MAEHPHLTVLYDGECTRCTRAAGWIERRDRGRGRVRCVPLQESDPPPGVTRAALETELHAVDAAGTVFTGWDAVVAVARCLPQVAWLVPLDRLPGVRRLGRALYRRVAGERGCADCIDQPARPT